MHLPAIFLGHCGAVLAATVRMVSASVMLVGSALGYVAAALVLLLPVLTPRLTLPERGQLAAACLLAGFVGGALVGGVAQLLATRLGRSHHPRATR
jgi:hypothetical protein